MTNTTKHTPGPWRRGSVPDDWNPPTREDCSSSAASIVDQSGRIVGFAAHPGLGNEPLLSNARLLAAAPELLEALKEAEAMFRWYGDMHQGKDPPATEKAIRNYDMAEKLAAVVANAEGRTDG